MLFLSSRIGANKLHYLLTKAKEWLPIFSYFGIVVIDHMVRGLPYQIGGVFAQFSTHKMCDMAPNSLKLNQFPLFFASTSLGEKY